MENVSVLFGAPCLGGTDLIGTGPAMAGVRTLVQAASASDVAVLLDGESGTGKGLLARSIHADGPRKDRPFIEVHCCALPGLLLESELFGHRRGAFQGAATDRQGLFEAADGATVFLSEVEQLPLAAQLKLLHLLRDGEVWRIGETRARHADVRLISATDTELAGRVRDRRFRGDLYYHIGVLSIHIPPLRSRARDIPQLALSLLRRSSARLHKQPAGISPEASELLLRYPWPGNIHELQNEIERAIAMTPPGQPLGVDALSEKLLDLRRSGKQRASSGSLKQACLEFEHQYVADVLLEAGGRVSAAARLLGMSRQTLYRKLKSHDLCDREERSPPARSEQQT